MFTKLIVIATVALSAISAQEFKFESQYPEYGIIPTAKPEWLELIKNAKIADAPVYKVTNGVKTPVGGTKGDHCDWTITNCLAKEDLYQCPKGQWAPTYDDGPSEFSGALYKELKKTNTKTTFFMVGGQVHKFPALVQEALADGHELAMHTWSHNYMTSLTNEQIVAELKWNELAIKEATKTNGSEGYSPRFFRPPYGDIDNRVRDVAKALGFTPVIWTHDTNDWALTENKNFKLEYVTGNVTAWTKEQSEVGGVSLEHDLYDVTVKAAIEVLPIFLNNWNVTTVGACNNQQSYKEGNGPNPPVAKPSISATPSASDKAKPTDTKNKDAETKENDSKTQNQKGENSAVSLASSSFALGVTAAAAIILS